jgi:PadR family transcriptional regulator AphA
VAAAIGGAGAGPAGAASLTASGHVVLGMVGLGARSGYEIKQMVEQSIRFFWTISPVQIYPALEQLEGAGLITGRDEPRGRRRRRVYEITEAGAQTLRQWLLRAAPMPFEIRDIGMVKLFFADALSPREAGELLDAIQRRSAERLATLRGIEPAALDAEANGDLYPLLTLRMGIAFHQAMIDVCQDFEAKVR